MAKYLSMLFIVVLCLGFYASAEPALGNLIGKNLAQLLIANVWPDAHEDPSVVDDDSINN